VNPPLAITLRPTSPFAAVAFGSFRTVRFLVATQSVLVPMAASAGVGSCGTVFHTKIARRPRRACNFMIPKGESAPAVFSIPIARSTFLPPRRFASRCKITPSAKALFRRACNGQRNSIRDLLRKLSPLIAWHYAFHELIKHGNGKSGVAMIGTPHHTLCDERATRRC